VVLLQTSLINLKQYKSKHYVSYLAAQVSPITPMNPSVIISKFYQYLLAEINWLLTFFINSYTQPAAPAVITEGHRRLPKADVHEGYRSH